MASVEERIIRLLENLVLQNFNIQKDSTWEQMGLDSLDKIEMMMDMEDEFNIDIPDEVMIYLENVEELIEYIEKVLKK